MAEIPRANWIKASMDAALKLLDARSRMAAAQIDVTAAEEELQRLTGRSSTIDLSANDYTHHFECEGTHALAVLEDKSQEGGTKPAPIEQCKNLVEVWGHTKDMQAPKICPSCDRAITARKAAGATPQPATPQIPEVVTKVTPGMQSGPTTIEDDQQF